MGKSETASITLPVPTCLLGIKLRSEDKEKLPEYIFYCVSCLRLIVPQLLDLARGTQEGIRLMRKVLQMTRPPIHKATLVCNRNSNPLFRSLIKLGKFESLNDTCLFNTFDQSTS